MFIQNSVIYTRLLFFRFFGIPMEILPNVRSSSEIYGLMVKSVVGAGDFIKKKRDLYRLEFNSQLYCVLWFGVWDFLC